MDEVMSPNHAAFLCIMHSLSPSRANVLVDIVARDGYCSAAAVCEMPEETFRLLDRARVDALLRSAAQEAYGAVYVLTKAFRRCSDALSDEVFNLLVYSAASGSQSAVDLLRWVDDHVAARLSDEHLHTLTEAVLSDPFDSPHGARTVIEETTPYMRSRLAACGALHQLKDAIESSDE